MQPIALLVTKAPTCTNFFRSCTAEPPNVIVHRKTDHFLQKLKFELLLLVDTSIFAEV